MDITKKPQPWQTVEEKKIQAGVLFFPGDPELKAIKLRTHNLDTEYNRTFEDETKKRAEILQAIVGELGEGAFMQGPIQFHYGIHTRIGKRFFANFNLTIQDDGEVTIGDDCNFGPNVTIVTPVHPMLGEERNQIRTEDGRLLRLCYAKPVHIGDNCVIGAGSVVTRDVPAGSFAAGNPCRVIRTLSEADSMRNKPERLGGCTVPER